jgi:CRP/FNR family transcriptional regulator
MIYAQDTVKGVGATGEASLTEIVRGLFPMESAAPVDFRPRTYVFHQGAQIAVIFLAARGSLVQERVDEDGHMAMFGVHRVGTLVGWQDLLDGGRHRNSCRTLTACNLIVLPRQKFERAMRQNEGLLLALMQQAATQANSYEEQIFRLSTLDVSERLYWALFALAGDCDAESDEIEVSTSLMKRDLAALVGTSPESISRGLRRLEKLKVAECTDRNTYRIVRPKRAVDGEDWSPIPAGKARSEAK